MHGPENRIISFEKYISQLPIIVLSRLYCKYQFHRAVASLKAVRADFKVNVLRVT